MRSLIYKLKEKLQGNAALYQLAYNTATFNLDYFKQRLHGDRYYSKFGGMWTDASDYSDKRAKLDPSLSAQEKTWLDDWHEKGVVVVDGAVDPALIDAYLADINKLTQTANSPLLMTTYNLAEPVKYTPDVAKGYKSVRMVDDYVFSKASRDLMFHPVIRRFLKLAFERDGVLTQSLRFDYGSEQPLHQDTAFVRMNSPMKLVGVWVALEDIQPGSGELLYLPGSHRWEGYLFSGRFKHYDAARDGEAQLDTWHQWIRDEAKARGVEPQSFRAKKGDVLFWHAALAHGGAPITDENQTRLSLVGHFCPEGVRPLYHYYKPGQRKYYREGDRRYTTSYYKR